MYEIKAACAEDVKNIRETVFSREQGYPESKLFDEKENSADFLALFEGGKAVGCGRFYKESENAYHIDNIALSDTIRGKGLGRRLIAALIDECKKNGAVRVTVGAKSEAVGFYEKCGFKVIGEKFKDENFTRVPMAVDI